MTNTNDAIAIEAQGSNPNLAENTYEPANDRKTWIGEQFIMTTRLGRELPCIALQGRTGSPDFYEYTPAYTRNDGMEISARFTTHLLVDLQNIPTSIINPEDTKGYKSFRITFWGEEADKARRALLDNNRTALILIKQGTISTYQDRYGEPRFSININFKGQYSVLETQQYEANQSFDDCLNNIVDNLETDAPF